tara:strand:- start:407 stop:1744 length:1338 start_codon:yes stop_codon:yes gene_type:complete
MKAFYSQRIFIEGVFKPGYLIVNEGRIEALLPQLPSSFPGEIIDYGGFTLLPGFIDCHVHVNEPGRTEWEGFETATQSASFGGITTLVDMPLNCSPVTISEEALRIKLQALQGKIHVDCAYWGGVTPGSINDLSDLLDAGVMGVKSFMIHSGLDEFPHVGVQHIREAMPYLQKAGLPYLVHAELDSGEATHIKITNRYQDFLDSRPHSFETNAIKHLIQLAEETRCRVHVVHLSSAEAIPMIAEARQSNIPLSVETCPHYLCLEAEAIDDGQTVFKCCPPIREHSNRLALWEGLRQGHIDMIVSDHSPCTPDLKLLEEGDLDKAWGGISSLQFSVSLMLTEAVKHGFELSDIIRWMSENPARFLGLEHRKGFLKPGADADIVVFDPNEKYTIKPSMILHRNKQTPYEQFEVQGKVQATYLRGQAVYKKNQAFMAPIGKSILRMTL